MTYFFTSRAKIAALLGGLMLVSSCGIKGELKTPPPVFGSDTQAKPLPPAPIEPTPKNPS